MDDAARHPLRPDPRADEFADFIEEDDLEDDDQTQRYQEEMEVAILTLCTRKDYLIHAKKRASPGPDQPEFYSFPDDIAKNAPQMGRKKETKDPALSSTDLADTLASDKISELRTSFACGKTNIHKERNKTMGIAIHKLTRVMVKSVKENMRNERESEVLKASRWEYSKKLDQAPYKPKKMVLGAIPRVLALFCGAGDPNRGAPVYGAWVEEDGRVMVNGKLTGIARDERAREELSELIQHRKPHVFSVSGFTLEADKPIQDVQDLIRDRHLRGADFDGPDTDKMRSEPLEVIVVNDEVVRLYRDSPRDLQDNQVNVHCL